MSRIRSRSHIPPEKQAELDRLLAQVKHAEGHDQFDTAHHTMLARLRAELGLIPARKTEGPKQDEVNDGKQNL